MPHPIPAAPSLRTASVLPRRRARGARRPRPPASPVCGPLAARVAGAGPGTRGGGAPIHAHSSDCPAAWPWDPAGPLRLPWGNNCGWKGEGVSRSDWSSDRRLRRGSPAPGTESTEGPRPEGPGPGEPGRDQQPLTAPIAALADLNWPRESSPQDPPPSHPRAQRRAHSHTHTPTYTHDRAHLHTPPHTYPHTHMDTNSPSHTCSHVPSQTHTCTHRHKHSHTQDTPEHTLMQAHALTYTLTQRSRCHTPCTQARSSTPTPLMVTRTSTHSYTLQRGHTYTRPQRTYTRGHTPKRTPHGLTHNCHCTLRHRDTHELTVTHSNHRAFIYTHIYSL